MSEKIIDWTNPDQKISTYFTVKDAIWLPKWNRLANDSDGLNADVKMALLAFFAKMDVVRAFFNKPIIVHCAFRPFAYNKLVYGAKRSAHLCNGPWAACDFHIVGVTCDAARKLLVPKLEEWGMRCENKFGSNWIHLDNKPLEPRGNRFFIP